MVKNVALSGYEKSILNESVHVIPFEESLKSAREEHPHGALGFPDQSDGDDDTPDLDVPGHSERTGWFNLLKSKVN